MLSDIVPGATFPDYELPHHTGTVHSLNEIQGDDPLILTFARGDYCPKQHQQHLELATHLFEDRCGLHAGRVGRRRVAIFSDPGRTVQRDIADPDHNPIIPHAFVLKPGLVVHSIYNGYWFWCRPSFYELWCDLRAVSQEIRPDWDLSAPGLWEAWDAGDYSRFRGWSTQPSELAATT